MKNTYIDILHREFVPALGCTEPVAVAYAAAKAREILGATPSRIEIKVSGNIYKNGLGVGIPGTGMVGLSIAAALGAVGGDSTRELAVLEGINERQVRCAKEMVSSNMVSVDVKYGVDKLYIEAILAMGEDQSRVVIQGRHTNVVYADINGEILIDRREVGVSKQKGCDNQGISFAGIYEFVQKVDLCDIEFLEKGIQLNKAISREGLKGDYGLQVGKNLYKQIQKRLLSEDLLTRAIYVTSAASDARMAGSTMPVMSNCGSGNQGISVTLPVVVAAEQFNSSREQLLRALALSLLTSIYMKSFVGQLSALCGVLLSTTGAACGMTYLMGGNFTQLGMTIRNMAGGVTGMICDGAKFGCSHKISASVGSAVQSSLLAMNNQALDGLNGIVDDDVETTIRNIGTLAVEGMGVTDEVILETMIKKQECAQSHLLAKYN